MAKAAYFDVESTAFIWKIKYPFFFINCNLNSPSFSIDSCGITRYYLNFISEKKDEGIYNVSLHLKKHEWDCEPSAVELTIHISITGYKIDERYYFDRISSFKNSEIIFKEDISIMNVRDVSTESDIVFSIEIEPVMSFQDVDDLWTCNCEDLESLSSDITRILRKKQFSDLTFRSVDGKSALLHKTIFASRYPSMAKSLDMFKNPKQEYNLGDDFEAISVLMLYLYSGKINKADSTFGLLELLNKANLHHLQHIIFSEPRIIHTSTSVPLKYGSFTWSVPNPIEIQNNKHIVKCIRCDNLHIWTQLRISLFVKENSNREKCVAFKIQRLIQMGRLLLLCKISILGREIHSESFRINFESKKEILIPSFIKVKQIQEKKKDFLINGSLKLRFDLVLSNLEEVSRYDSIQCIEDDEKQPTIAVNIWALRKDISGLYRNSAFSDVTIHTGKLLIPAHKVILCARSPVFSRVLQEEIKTIVINNYDERIVLDILSYIYCGTVISELKSLEWAVKMYKAANEYQISQLKQKCTRFIKTILNPKNREKVLKLAKEYNDISLRQFIRNVVFT